MGFTALRGTASRIVNWGKGGNRYARHGAIARLQRAAIEALEQRRLLSGVPVADPGFANPNVVGNGGYQYNPTGTPWTFANNAGIEADGSVWGAPAAPDGDGRAAYIQNYAGGVGTVSQSVYLEVGTYSLMFDAAQRGGLSVNPIQFSVDGSDVGDPISPASASTWTSYTTDSFTITAAGQHTIAFAGTGSSGDCDTFIDEIGGPASAANLTAIGTVGQVALSWSAISGASSYNIYRSTTAGGEGSTPYESGITATSYSDTDVDSGQTYYYTLTVVAGGAESSQGSEVSATTSDGSSGIAPMLDPGFANPNVVSAFSYTYDPSGTPWTFANYAGIEADGSARGAPAAPDGDGHAAYIQNYAGTTGAISQSVFLEAGSYSLAFDAAQRGGFSINPIQFSVDGSDVGDPISPASASTWASYTTDTFTITSAGQHTIGFAGTGSSGDDDTFIDAINAPAPPTGFAATAGVDQIALSWSAVSGAASYNLFRATTSGGEGSSPYKTGLAGTTFTDTGLGSDQTFYYTIAAVEGDVASPQSSEASATTGVDGPATISAVGDAGQVQLSWAPVTGATSYDIYRASSSGGEGTTPYQTGITNSYFTDTGLPAAASEYYIVTAFTPAGTSTPSAEASAITDSLPESPTSLTATADSGGATLSWTASPDALTYNIYRGTSSLEEGSTPIYSGDEAVMYTDTSASPGTTYYYFVTPVSDAGEGSPSNETSILTVPAAPTISTATAGDTTIALAWTAVPSATSYNLYQGTGPGDESSTPEQTGLTNTTFTDSSLDDGTTYYYTLTAVNASGESLASAEVSATPIETAPTVATAATASLSSDGTTVTLTTLGADAGGESNLAYSWTATTPDGVDDPFFADSDDNTAKDTTATLFGAGDYTFTTIITNNNQLTATTSVSLDVSQIESSVSVAAPMSTLAPSEADAFSAVALDQFGNTMATQPSFTWAVAAGGAGGAIDTSGNYTASTASTGADTITATTDDSADMVGLATVTLTPTGLATPGDVFASPADGEVDLSWDADPNAASYSIYRGTTSGGEDTTPIATGLTSATFSDTSLTDGTTYYYFIVSEDTLGESPASAEVSATPLAPPAAPTDLSASAVSSNEIDLSWADPSDGVASFLIERSDDGGSTFNAIDTVTAGTTTYQDTSVSDGVSEVYEVAAFNTAATSAFSDTATASTPMAVPDNFTATAASTSEIDLSWTNESQAATSLTILRAPVGGTYSTVATISNGTTSTYADTGLPSGTTYSYEVQANEGTIASTTSTSATATTDLDAPTGLAVVDTGAGVNGCWVDLTWNPVVGATGYAIEREGGPGSDGFAIVGGTDSISPGDIYRDQQYVIFGNNYTYQIVAYDDSDRSEPSETASAETPILKPGAPMVSAQALSNTTVEVDWIPAGAAGGGLATSFEVDRYNYTTSTWTSVTSISASDTDYSYIATGLSPGQQYLFGVTAINSAGSNFGAQFQGAYGNTPNNSTNPASYTSAGTATVTLSMGLAAAAATTASPSGEGNLAQPDWINLSRSGGTLTNSLTVNLSYTGDAKVGTDYAALPSSVTFGPGQVSQVLEIDPLDWEPRSGKLLTATTEPGTNYTVASYASAGTASLSPHGLAISLDQGEPYPIISSNTPGSLMPLHLTVPGDLADGSTVTVSTGSENVAIYTSNATGTTETPLTLSADCYVWTYTGPGSIPTTLYVGATGGDISVGDTTFGIFDHPASQPGDPSPAGQDPPTPPATADPITITLKWNPNSDTMATGPVENKTLNWLVGQDVSLTATYTGSDRINAGRKFTVSVPGNKLQYFKENTDASTTAAYSTSSTTYPGTGTQVSFFWVSTDNNAASQLETVKFSLKGTTLAPGEVTFDLYEPSSTGSVSMDPNPVGKDGANEIGLVANEQIYKDSKGDQSPYGIIFTAGVTSPAPFQKGTFSYLQTADLSGDTQYLSHNMPGPKIPLSNVGTDWLDGGIAYPAAGPTGWIIDQKNDVYKPMPTIQTDGPSLVGVDLPLLPLGPKANGNQIVAKALYAASFKTYVMYTPPAANGAMVYSVPLLIYNWKFSVTGGFPANVPTTVITAPGSSRTFVPWNKEPFWTHSLPNANE